MSKTVAKKKSFNFVGGLNTEAGPLTSPENTWREGINIVPKIDGSLNKRAAIDYENGYQLSATAVSVADEDTGAFVNFEWDAVAGNGALNFVAVQRGSIITFYENVGDGVSPTEFVGQDIDTSVFKVLGNPNVPGVAPFSFANANGKLLCTSTDCEPFLITYDQGTGTFSAQQVDITIRDLAGIADGLDVDEEPAVLSPDHEYNLLNQGWSSDHITTYFGAHSVYPSNAQQWTAGKDTDDVFDAALLRKQDFGTSPAPRGRFVLSPFNMDRAAASGVVEATNEIILSRPSTCAFYAGRAWYAGINSPKHSSWVLYSQVATDETKFGLCHQEADPTSEFISDLVASDGGVVPIQEVGDVTALRVAYNSLIVFADNGVWQIQGGLETGFSATSYDVRKLTSAGCISPTSIVDVEQGILYWSNDGIWQVAPSQTGGLAATNITALTIQTLYTAIPMIGRAYASGRYHLEGKCVYWAYNDTAGQDGVSQRYRKNKLLVLDVRLNAFYILEVSDLDVTTPYITDLIITKPKSGSDVTYNVVVGGDQVSNGINDLFDFDAVQTDIGGTADTTQLYLLPDGSEVYSIGNGSNSVSIHDFDNFLATPTSVAILDGGPIGDAGNGVLSVEGTKLWMSGQYAVDISVMDVATRVMTNMGQYNSGWSNFVVAATDTHVYIGDSNGVSKHTYNIGTGTINAPIWDTRGDIDLVQGHKPAEFDLDGNLWFAQGQKLHVYNATTGTKSSHTLPSSLSVVGRPAYDWEGTSMYVIGTATVGAATASYLYRYHSWTSTSNSGTWELIETFASPGAQYGQWLTYERSSDILFMAQRVDPIGGIGSVSRWTGSPKALLDTFSVSNVSGDADVYPWYPTGPSLIYQDPYAYFVALNPSLERHIIRLNFTGNLVLAVDNVTISLTPYVLRNTEVKFLTVHPNGTNFNVTYADFDAGLVVAKKFKDWYSFDNTGATYQAYILTGYDMGANQGGDTAMQGLYMTAFFRRTEATVDPTCEVDCASSCTMQARWDWTDLSTSGKWTPGEEIYRHNRLWLTGSSSNYTDGYPVVWSKSKIRGRGKAVQFKFTAHPEKDMQMLGWAITYLGNQNV